jgi:hypothetical protein
MLSSDVQHESNATRSRPSITSGFVPIGDVNSSFVQSQTLERRAFPRVIEHIHFNDALKALVCASHSDGDVCRWTVNGWDNSRRQAGYLRPTVSRGPAGGVLAGQSDDFGTGTAKGHQRRRSRKSVVAPGGETDAVHS